MGRTFWLANAVILLDEVLYLFLVPLLPTYAERFDLSKAEAGFLYAAYPLLLALTAIPGGLLADRLGGKRLLALGAGLLVAATVGFAYAETAWQLWTMRALQGVTAGLVTTAGMASIAAAAPSGRRATTIGLAVSLQGLSALAGYVLGGFVSPVIGIERALLIPAAVGVVICIATALHRSGPLEQPTRIAPRSVFVNALRSPAVRAAVACIFIAALAGSSVQSLASIQLGAAGFSAGDLGIVFVVAALLGFASTPLAGRMADRYGVVPTIVVWSLVIPLVVLALGVPGEPAWLIAALLALVLPLARIGGSLAYARGAEHARFGEGLAAGYGLAITAWSAGAAIGPLTAGAIADATHDQLAFVAIGLLVLVLAWPATRPGSSPVEAS